uniref:Uncharacterized protein n=1 Tax=Haptolina ericina TaxID=156174 RepID=A0A7S3F5Y9_9EUKA|mmetsp:Transcript_51455/g.115566  ORF Transcript_51455/g.115566 Transcript_51455/m.115566 type:complete len:222 (+) Transcript_51455:47-712(+)
MKLSDPNRSYMSLARQYAALGAAAYVIVLAASTIAGCFMVIFVLPLFLATFVDALCNLVLGVLMLCLHFHSFPKTISKYFGFLDLRLGRVSYYLFVGCSSVVNDDKNHALTYASYGAFLACWFVGFLELCGPGGHLDEAPLDPTSTLSQPLAGSAQSASWPPPSGGSLACHSNGNISINLTPSQVAAGANLLANNADSVAAAAARASVASASQPGANPFKL